MNVAGWLLICAWVSTVVWYGGMGWESRALAMALMACGLIAAMFSGRRAMRPPTLTWWWLLAVVVVLPPVAQSLPLGWTHPWAAADCVALGVDPSTWAVDADAALRSAAWAATWVTAIFLGLFACRHERAWKLAEAIVAIAAVHAVAAILLAVLLPDWPSPHGAGRVRGTFVYVNHAAGLWAACLPLALALTRSATRGRRWYLAASIALATALALSASRGGILVGALVAAPFAWAALPQRRRWLWAVAGLAAIALWLGALGLDPVQRRFIDLSGKEGVTLSGRVTIWQTAGPQALDAGPWGAGPGAEPLAYLRGGQDFFPGVVIDRLHSDPLEWLVCYGWVGLSALLVAMSATVVWAIRAWHAQPPDADTRGRVIALGAGGGLAVLILHSMAEFTWHSPALALLGALLLVVATGSLTAAITVAPRATWRWRIAAAAGALALVTAGAIEWPLANEDALAWHARGDAIARQETGQPIDTATSFHELMDASPETTLGALAAAELSLACDPPATERARAALAVVAERSPAQPLAWALRVRMAAAAGDTAGLETALDRLRTWAPAWAGTRQAELAALMSPIGAQIDPTRRKAVLIDALQKSTQALPPAVLQLANEELGDAALADLLVNANGGLMAQADLWLSQRGSLEAWLALRQRRELWLPASSWLIAPPQAHLDLPRDAIGRQQTAHALGQYRLPMPPDLLAALAADGSPGADESQRWLAPGAPADVAWLQRLVDSIPMLESRLYLPGMRQAWEEALLAKAILAGHTEGVTRAHWPPLVDLAVDQAASTTEFHRLRGIIAAQQIDQWLPLPGDKGFGHWWDPANEPPPEIHQSAWVGLAIDGQWIGWRRGDFSVPEVTTSGRHFVQILIP